MNVFSSVTCFTSESDAFRGVLLHRLTKLILIGAAAVVSIEMQKTKICAAETGVPNIVLILADDLGYADIGAYGNKVNRTPNLDRMACEGMRFTDFHTNGANCSPTRAALLTGRYQQRSGIDGALGEGARGLPRSEVTIAERLKLAGYATGLMGKWHLGYYPGNGPLHHGFDEFVGHLHGATDYISHVDKYGRMDWWHNDKPVEESGHNTNLITDHSIRFIKRHRNEPFFLFVSHSSIHFPWMTTKDKAHRRAGTRYEGITGKLGPHAAGPVQPVVQRMIEELDNSVGQIMTALKRLQLDKTTLVFFTSDNGGIVRMAGVPITEENRISSNAPFRGQKHGLYEGGHRVPAIARWPGEIPAGVTCGDTAITMDLFPTMLEIAGVAPVGSGDPTYAKLDGISICCLLRQQETLPSRNLFWSQGDSRAVRSGKWKIVSIHRRPFELYDLNMDIAERKNLAQANPQKLTELKDYLKSWERGFDE